MGYEKCIEALKNGEKILIFDSDEREGETDIVQPAKGISYEDIRFMRKNGGGLICVTLPHEVAEDLGLPFMSDILKKAGFEKSDIPYGEKSSFSLWVNHKETFTGITDKDRAKTANKLSDVHKDVLKNKNVDFKKQFRFPGHVPILKGAKNYIRNRRGHTELSMAIADDADVLNTMVVCEMLSDDNGEALPRNKAKEFSEEKGLPMVDGKEIIEEY